MGTDKNNDNNFSPKCSQNVLNILGKISIILQILSVGVVVANSEPADAAKQTIESISVIFQLPFVFVLPLAVRPELIPHPA